MTRIIIILTISLLASSCNKANQTTVPTSAPVTDEATVTNIDSQIHKTFIDESNLKWEAAQEHFDKPFYHGNDGLSMDEFTKRMQPKENPDNFSDCTSTKLNASADESIELIQCKILNDEGEYEDQSCDADGMRGMPIGLFLSIDNAKNKSMDVHWLGYEYSKCDAGYFWRNDYEYSLEYAYSEPLGDTNAIHAVVREYKHNNDCDHDRAVDGLDCREETVVGTDRHYIFAGEEYRLVGSYPERILTKTVNGCGIVACGKSLEAELYETKMTIKPDRWQLMSNRHNMSMKFSSKEELEKQEQAYRNGEDCAPPKVLPQYEKYIKYAKADLAFDQEELQSFFEPLEAKLIMGDIDKTFKVLNYKIEIETSD